jgi:hypothetical protein
MQQGSQDLKASLKPQAKKREKTLCDLSCPRFQAKILNFFIKKVRAFGWFRRNYHVWPYLPE